MGAKSTKNQQHGCGTGGGGAIIPTPPLQLYNAGIQPARFMMVCLVMCHDVHGGKMVEMKKGGGVGGKWGKWGKMGRNGGRWEEMGVQLVPSVRAWCGYRAGVPLIHSTIGGGIRTFVAGG